MMKFDTRKTWLIVYGATIIFFLVYIFFLADHSIKKQRELDKKVEMLDNKIDAIHNNIGIANTYDEIVNNPKLMEKYAREQLGMQQADEDVFIMVH